jgi:hypothetical protein
MQEQRAGEAQEHLERYIDSPVDIGIFQAALRDVFDD